MKYISSKIKDFVKEVMYEIGDILCMVTPIVPGDLQTIIADHYRFKREPSKYVLKEQRRIEDYLFPSSVSEVLEIGIPVINSIEAHGPSLSTFAATAYLIGDLVWRENKYLSFYYDYELGRRCLVGDPVATMAIEIPYQLAKLGYKTAKSSKQSLEEKIKKYKKTLLKE